MAYGVFRVWGLGVKGMGSKWEILGLHQVISEHEGKGFKV